MKQLCCETPQSKWLGPGSSCSAAPSIVTAPAPVLQLWPGKHSLRWKLNALSIEAEVKLAYIEKSSHPRPSLVHFYADENRQSFWFGPNSTILSGWNGAAVIGGKDLNKDIAAQL